jgi:hypothetical protein
MNCILEYTAFERDHAVLVTIAVRSRGEVCPRRPMPTEAYALCQIVPHVTEKGYSIPALH